MKPPGIAAAIDERGVARLGEPVEASTDHLPHAFGQVLGDALGRADPGVALVSDRAGLHEVAEDLGDEEGVALGLPEDELGELAGGLLTADRLDERLHLLDGAGLRSSTRS